METRLIEYILTISKEKSIFGAANALYITQSALNQQLLKLEKELGAALFIRTRNHWELTEVGKLYVENAQKILHIKNQTYSQIQDMAQKWHNTVTVGFTPERGIQMFTAIYPQIHKKYPETTFQPVEATVDEQIKKMRTGEIDISFQTVFEHRYQHLTYQKILDEPFCLCVPKSHPLAYQETLTPEEYPKISLALFRDDLFTLVKKSSTMRTKIDAMFKESGFVPKLLFESTSMRTMQQLASGGQCCAVIPRYYAVSSEDVAYYYLEDSSYWELVVAYDKSHYINRAMRDFITLATDYWRLHPYIE